MRWIWHGLWVCSLLLAVGAGALWVSCGWWTYHHYFRQGPERWLKSAVFVEDGFVMACVWQPYMKDSLIQPGEEEGFIETQEGKWWEDPELAHDPTFQFAWVTLDLAPRGHNAIGLDWLYFPLAYLVALFLLLPLGQAGRWGFYFLRDRRGLCVNCGYDLRGNTSGPCPECGYGHDKAKESRKVQAGVAKEDATPEAEG